MKPAKKKRSVARRSKRSPPKLRDLMTSPVLTLTAGQPASDAWALLRAEEVRHAVVLRGRSVIGVVSDRDLGGPNGGAARRGKTVGEMMRPDPIVLGAGADVEQAAEIFEEAHIGCVPVLEGRDLVGIVTRTDLLRLLAPRAAPKPRAPRRGAAEAPRPPRLASPNADKWH